MIMDHIFDAYTNNPVLTEDMSTVGFIFEIVVLLPGMNMESIEICKEVRFLLGVVRADNHSAAISSQKSSDPNHDSEYASQTPPSTSRGTR